MKSSAYSSISLSERPKRPQEGVATFAVNVSSTFTRLNRLAMNGPSTPAYTYASQAQPKECECGRGGNARYGEIVETEPIALHPTESDALADAGIEALNGMTPLLVPRGDPPALLGRHAKFDNSGSPIVTPKCEPPSTTQGRNHETSEQFKSHPMGV